MTSENNRKRHKIKRMRAITFSVFSRKDKKELFCSVCNEPINVGDKYFYNKYKHYKYNHVYCEDCAIEKNLLVR